MVLAPEVGESFTGWLTRYAFDIGLPVGLLVESLGIPIRATSVDRHPQWADICITDVAQSQLHAATTIEPDAFAGSCVSAFDGTLVDLAGLDLRHESTMRLVAAREWILIGRSRACPACLATDGVWRTWWRLGLAGVCPQHGTVLVDACPACGHPLGSGLLYTLSHPPHPPWVCGRPCRGRLCVQDLRTLATSEAPAAAVDAQRRLLDAVNDTTVTLAGVDLSVRDWRHEWVTLMNVIRGTNLPTGSQWPNQMRSAWQHEHHRLGHANGCGSRRGTPASGALAAGILAATNAVTAAPDTNTAHHAVRDVIIAAGVTPARGQQSHWKAAEALPVLGGALACHRPRQARIAGLLASSRAPRISASVIPTQIDADLYEKHFAALLPHTAARTGRVYAAMCIARACCTASWAKAAAALGIPTQRGTQISDVVTRRVQDPHQLGRAVRHAAEQFAEQNTDYSWRRSELGDLYVVTPHLLRPIFDGRRITPSRTVHAAAWIWDRVAFSPPAWSPAHTAAIARGRRPDSLAEVFRRFSRSLSSTQQEQLIDLGIQMIGGRP